LHLPGSDFPRQVPDEPDAGNHSARIFEKSRAKRKQKERFRQQKKKMPEIPPILPGWAGESPGTRRGDLRIAFAHG
jgi:hypothetical protein